MSRSKPFRLVTPEENGEKNGKEKAATQKGGNGASALPCGCSHDFEEALRIQAERRRQPSEGPWPAAERDGEISRGVHKHLGGYCGKWEGVVHEKASWLVYLEVFVYGPTEKHPYVDFFTAGMSQLAMNDPHARHTGLPDRAELMLQLPASWAGGKPVLPQLSTAEMCWPVLLLQRLARLPHELRKAAVDGSMVHWDPGAYAGLPFDGAMYMTTAWCETGIAPMITKNLVGVDFLQVIPLHGSEIAFAEKHGPLALQDRLLAAGVDDTIVLHREAVI